MLLVTGNILNSEKRNSKWLDGKTGQKRERMMQDIRFMIGKDICCLSIDAENAVDCKAGQQIEVGIRKCDEKSGFYTIYGEVVKVR